MFILERYIDLNISGSANVRCHDQVCLRYCNKWNSFFVLFSSYIILERRLLLPLSQMYLLLLVAHKHVSKRDGLFPISSRRAAIDVSGLKKICDTVMKNMFEVNII